MVPVYVSYDFAQTLVQIHLIAFSLHYSLPVKIEERKVDIHKSDQVFDQGNIIAYEHLLTKIMIQGYFQYEQSEIDYICVCPVLIGCSIDCIRQIREFLCKELHVDVYGHNDTVFWTVVDSMYFRIVNYKNVSLLQVVDAGTAFQGYCPFEHIQRFRIIMDMERIIFYVKDFYIVI